MLDDFTLKLIEIVGVCAVAYGAMMSGMRAIVNQHKELRSEFLDHVRDRRVHK